jgi:hypothetical protein
MIIGKGKRLNVAMDDAPIQKILEMNGAVSLLKEVEPCLKKGCCEGHGF